MKTKHVFSFVMVFLLTCVFVFFGSTDSLLASDPGDICDAIWCSQGEPDLFWTFNVTGTDPTLTFASGIITCGGNFYADNHLAAGADADGTDDDILVWVNENFEETGTYHGGLFQISTDHDDQNEAN